ncbi:DUF433 domain-containing protein [Nocardia sp. NPDC051030]|uniref:DUF433 domain-containing protein n=1 Tax=Nocardia sp. NPDC051030 TaxID=3155162 RepID=UPI003441B4B7
MPNLDRITSDLAVCGGIPVIRGHRYPVALLLDLMVAGVTPEELLADFRGLDREDLVAVLEYATLPTPTPSPIPARA